MKASSPSGKFLLNNISPQQALFSLVPARYLCWKRRRFESRNCFIGNGGVRLDIFVLQERNLQRRVRFELDFFCTQIKYLERVRRFEKGEVL